MRISKLRRFRPSAVQFCNAAKVQLGNKPNWLALATIKLFPFAPVEINNWRGHSIYKLLFTHGPQVAPSFYSTKKGGEEVHSTLASHMHSIILNYWH
jgi:hypothetical protein